jgi:hypothetical protein
MMENRHTNIWIVILTDKPHIIEGKTFIGVAQGIEGAKQLAKDAAPDYLAEHSIAEIDGLWCIQGREPSSDKMSFIVPNRLVLNS